MFRFLLASSLALNSFRGSEAAHSLPDKHLDSKDGMTFLTLGDWGAVNSDQAAVAAQLKGVAKQSNPQYLVALGDNFYEDGVESDTDQQWTDTYQNVYNDASLNIPWYAIEGNHDHHQGRGVGEINYYLNKRDNRWVMPYYYYTQFYTFTENNKNVSVQWIFIDTPLMVDYNTTAAEGQEQIDWFKNSISTVQADWLFVAGHYPVYSGGEHGDTDIIVNAIRPLMEEYNVDAYFCGHDHTLQHLQSNKINYFVSGNGAKRGTYQAEKQNLWGSVDPGFTLNVLNSTHMVTNFIDLNGITVYSYTQARLQKSNRK